MPNYYYVQQIGKVSDWKPIPASAKEVYLREHKPEFITVLSVSKLVDDLPQEEKEKLAYDGPMYFDFDGPDIALVLVKVNEFLDKLRDLSLDLTSISCFITGGKGFHIEIPQTCWLEKPAKNGIQYLPTIFREVALELCVDTLDLRVYSQSRGRMWRVPNNLRKNGLHKVPVTAQDIRGMTAETYIEVASKPRGVLPKTQAHLCVDLAILYAKFAQKVEEKMKSRGKFKKNPNDKLKAHCTSIEMMMAGEGIQDGVGFHELALQIAIAAVTSGLTEQKMLEECQGLIDNHESSGDRYNTPAKRRAELARMFAYCDDNPCYQFSVGAVKSLLNHPAPDLDGISASREEIVEGIAEAKELAADDAARADAVPDEFEDTSGGVTLNKFGVYVNTDGGKKRICAISFKDIHLLIATETGQLCAYEAEVLVNGRATGRQTMEIDTFSSVQMFNRFAARLGHAMQGVETHVRGLMMRFVELAKKKGRMRYIVKREGLDLVNIPNHEDLELRKPFMVWADTRGVILDPRVAGCAVDMSFQGFPTPSGVFKADLADAPPLAEWLEAYGNKDALKETLLQLFTCQRAEVIGKLLGWYTASVYRMLFHKAYGQFPILHVNGSAGCGKCFRLGTEVIMASGAVKKIEDVVVGDQLLGPDGTVRNVLELGRGREDMWEVKPVKGDAYYVNGSHILSLKRSYGRTSCKLSDGTVVPASQQILNVNVRVFAASSKATQKQFKGYRPEAVEFVREQENLPLDPYWLGCWLGDGSSYSPSLHKPECNMTRWWVAHAESNGCFVSERNIATCSLWAITGSDRSLNKGTPRGPRKQNKFLNFLKELNLLGNKHIPDSYKFAPVSDRLRLIAGLLDSDGHLHRSGYDWISKDEKMAKDFTWICRSVGLAAYMSPCQKSIKKLGFVGTYYRVCVSGDCDRIPCLDKKAPPRKQIKDHLVTGLTFKELGVEDYYGVVLDGDHLFMLGDFTVTHNTATNKGLMSLFYYNQEPKMLTPGSTLFAVQQHMAGSASIPLILDEYKPQEMNAELHAKYKLLIRDAYNCRSIAKGGGTRESDDYRSLHQTELAAPLVVIAEAAEEEAAVSERVVLVTFVKPPSSVANLWASRFHAWSRNGRHLTMLGQWLVGQAIKTSSIDGLREEFDPLYQNARETYMLFAADLEKNLDLETLSNKQNAKERSVFNFTVARFGLVKFRRLIESIYGDEFESKFNEMEEGIYTRMSDLQGSTQPEWAKVMNMMSTMSYNDAEDGHALTEGRDYAFVTVGGKDCIELAMRSAYLKYRSFCRHTNSKPLYAGDQSFLQAIKDSPAFVYMGQGRELALPGVYSFDTQELARLNVQVFK